MDKDTTINHYMQVKSTLEHHVNNLEKLIIASGKMLEGNSFYIHETLIREESLLPKQLNTFWTGLQAKKRICEIGFNAGHSTLLMLAGRDTTPIEFTIFDIGHHAYTQPCLDYMKEAFPHVTFEYIEGDSTTKLPNWTSKNMDRMWSYDVVHIDGGHSEHCVKNDMKNAIRLLAPGGYLIVDDTNIPYISNFVEIYLQLGQFTEVDVCVTPTYPHRILQKVVNV